MTTGNERSPGALASGWGYAACVWCAFFAVLHIYWAAGGGIGLASSAGASLASRRPLWFVLLGLWGVALLLTAGAAFSLGLARWRPQGTLRMGMLILGWLAGALLAARGVLLEIVLLTGLGGVASSVGPLETRWSLIVWDPWFAVGGLALLAATFRLART